MLAESGSEMINIKVAVRIRPFSERELTQRDEVVVQKDDGSILVTNPKICGRQDGDSRKRTRRFSVDHCYDPGQDPTSSSQEAVYREIGLDVLESMFDGYNACVLAYGHSASGKTYTMMGCPGDPGLTPRICHGLFARLGESNSNIRFQIVVSFLEIYNEKVRDLLGRDDGEGTSSLNHFSLRVREHPKSGPYVQDLSRHAVTDERQLLDLLDFGNRRRRTAATENNVHSSRSHSVFTILFRQANPEHHDTDKTSKVHLVDLAGSERASYSQSKARLKEGANINKSLVTLGNVISALAENCKFSREQSSLKYWQPFVPYRDSILTWLLKDTLGGNSKTIMIATVSPASSCLNETVNTLRYAKRTKRIINQPVVNEDPKTRTIRELREEIIRLRCMLSSKCGRSDKEEMTESFTDSLNRSEGGMAAVVKGRDRRDMGIECLLLCERSDSDGAFGRDAGNDDEKKSVVNGSVALGNSAGLVTPIRGFTGPPCRRGRETTAMNGTRRTDDVEEAPWQPGQTSKRYNKSTGDWNRRMRTDGGTWPNGESRRGQVSGDGSRSNSDSSLTSTSELQPQTSSKTKRTDSSGPKKTDVAKRLLHPVRGRANAETKPNGYANASEVAACKRARDRLCNVRTGPKVKKTVERNSKSDITRTSVSEPKSGSESDTLGHGARADRVTVSPLRTDLRRHDRRQSLDETDDYFSEDSLDGHEVTRTTVNGTREDTRRQRSNSIDDISGSDENTQVERKKKIQVTFFTGVPSLESLTRSRSRSSVSLESVRSDSSLATSTTEPGTGVGDSDLLTESSESSSEDFIFYECPKVLDRRSKKSSADDRELYTITENSEQSDRSETFSPVQQVRMSRLGDVVSLNGNRESESGKTGSLQPSAKTIGMNSRTGEHVPSSLCADSSPERNGRAYQQATTTEEEKKARSFSASKSKRPNWTDVQSNGTQAQFLNFNIFGGSSGESDFSIDTHLFGRPLRKDRSPETVFASQDSITFVFMGPAKPKTSVLMEIIGRTLRGIPPGSSGSRRRMGKAAKGSDSRLLRSVSVDTALMALSRIARHSPRETVRTTTSLDSLVRSDTPDTDSKPGKSANVRENGCQCDISRTAETPPLRYSVSTTTVQDEQTETSNSEDNKDEPLRADKTNQTECLIVPETTNGVLTEVPVTSGEGDEDSSAQTRRVRFSKFESEESVSGTAGDTLSTFLKEATVLLRALNRVQVRDTREPTSVRVDVKAVQTDAETRTDRATRATFRTSQNSTWPRRGVSGRKPPRPGANLKCCPPKVRVSSLSHSLHADAVRVGPASSRSGSGLESPAWTISNLSTTFSNSYVAEGRTRASRSWVSPAFSQQSLSSSLGVRGLDLESFSRLEQDLEESCRRLKLATDQSLATWEMLGSRLTDGWTGDGSRSGRTQQRQDHAPNGPRDPVKRFRVRQCDRDACTCKRRDTNSCTCPRWRAFRSTFDLNTFGPGSNHCREFCIFCRGKDREVYSSTPTLNSVCSTDLCRLNFYGHCPCSGVKLTHVTPSPRAYMQHLLTLRRRIVGRTAVAQLS